jgi:hypothetical protein
MRHPYQRNWWVRATSLRSGRHHDDQTPGGRFGIEAMRAQRDRPNARDRALFWPAHVRAGVGSSRYVRLRELGQHYVRLCSDASGPGPRRSEWERPSVSLRSRSLLEFPQPSRRPYRRSGAFALPVLRLLGQCVVGRAAHWPGLRPVCALRVDGPLRPPRAARLLPRSGAVGRAAR